MESESSGHLARKHAYEELYDGVDALGSSKHSSAVRNR
jgi:hypothetical protein